MKIRDALLGEHSKAQCLRIVDYIGGDRKKFATLMTLFFTGGYRISQPAAWPMSYVAKAHPRLIETYIGRMVAMLADAEAHPAIARNVLRILQDIPIAKRHHGKLMAYCFDFVQDVETPIAIKAFALSVLQQLSKTYPEILPELKTIIEDRWAHETPAFRSRAKRILKTI